MTNDFFAPVDSVSRGDRENAEARLRTAHQLGQIGAAEFETRLSRVIAADRLDQLAAAVDGPLPIEAPPQYRSYSEPAPGYVSGAVVAPSTDKNTTLALIAHLSPFLTWLIGPLVIWAMAPAGSYAKREAAKAFNWQLIAFVAGLVFGVLGNLLPGDGNPLAGIWTAIWVVLTVLGAVGAAKGNDWRNPIRAAVPWEVLSERRR